MKLEISPATQSKGKADSTSPRARRFSSETLMTMFAGSCGFMRRILFDQDARGAAGLAHTSARVPPCREFFCRFSLFSALDKERRVLFFIHNGHKSAMAAARKPHNHAALECNLLKIILKPGRVFFNRRTKYAFGNSTYLLFVQTIHNVIHKDCGQFFWRLLRLIKAVKCNDANLPVLAMQFKVSRFF